MTKQPSDLYMESPDPVPCRDLTHAISQFGIHPEDGHPVLNGNTLIGFAYNRASAEALAKKVGVAFLSCTTLVSETNRPVAFLLLGVRPR